MSSPFIIGIGKTMSQAEKQLRMCAAFNITSSESYTDIKTDKSTESKRKLLQTLRNIPHEKKSVVITVSGSITKS